jgi:hypothetical protein
MEMHIFAMFIQNWLFGCNVNLKNNILFCFYANQDTIFESSEFGNFVITLI